MSDRKNRRHVLSVRGRMRNKVRCRWVFSPPIAGGQARHRYQRDDGCGSAYVQSRTRVNVERHPTLGDAIACGYPVPMKIERSIGRAPVLRRPRRPLWRTASLAALVLSVHAVGADAQTPRIIGWTEPVAIAGGTLTLTAKMDTGADGSSIDARAISVFKRDGERWVSFVVGDDGNAVKLERKLLRMVRVRRMAGGWQRRPVVMLDVCLGDVRRTTPVNLADREEMRTPMLIGRSFLDGDFAVLSSRTHTTVPRCGPAAKQ
jgi:hypothetical protein